MVCTVSLINIFWNYLITFEHNIVVNLIVLYITYILWLICNANYLATPQTYGYRLC